MAAYDLDMSQDYLVWDNTETVAVYPAPRSDSLFFPVEYAKRRALTIRELSASGGAYTSQDRVWLLPVETSQALTDAFPPTPGFVIEDGQLGAWTVLDCSLNTWQTWWRCTTRNLVIAANLRDLISIQRPTIEVGDSGQPVYLWPPNHGSYVVQDLPAKVQLTDSSPIVVNEVETAGRNYDVILSQQVDYRKDDRLVWNGMAMEIKRLWNPNLIGELPRLMCERV